MRPVHTIRASPFKYYDMLDSLHFFVYARKAAFRNWWEGERLFCGKPACMRSSGFKTLPWLTFYFSG